MITVILMHCGLRVTDALRLRSDCVTTDTDGAPYLRYFNHKMHRDARVPVDTELADAIGQQRQRTFDRWPAGTAILFPRPQQEHRRRSPDQLVDLPDGVTSVGWPTATSVTSTATECISRRTNGVTLWALG